MPYANKRATLHHSRQRGVVIIMTLIALLILLITAVALVRSLDSSTMIAGNISYKRDLVNNADQGVAAAITALSTTTGVLYSDTTLASNQYALNYSAIILSTNSKGIPTPLIMDDTAFAAAGWSTANDITVKDPQTNVTTATVRYVIDRQCSVSGTFSTIKYTSCVFVPSGGLSGDSSQDAFDNNAGTGDRAIYRISIRVKGADGNTQTFVQSTVAR